MPILINFVLPLALSLVNAYIKNSSSKHDDLILQASKDSIDYLAQKDNNTVDGFVRNSVAYQSMKGGL